MFYNILYFLAFNMKNIIDFLDDHGNIDDEAVAYNTDGPYPFTLGEFRAFTDKIWNDAGGWDASGKYHVPAFFETYYIPFEYDEKKYVLVVMYGQGSAITLHTEAFHDEYKQRVAEIKYEDVDLPDQYDS